MKLINSNFNFFSKDELYKLHEATLAILENPGMKIMVPSLLSALEKKGAKVDHGEQVVKFPPKMVQRTIDTISKEVREGKKIKIINGVVYSKTDGGIQAKFGGACLYYFDWEKSEVREATTQDMVSMIRLGEALPQVKTVGNPVMCLKDDNGRTIDPRIRTIKGAALIAKNTSKPGPSEVWSPQELDFLVRIGCVVRGGWNNYKENPCFITAKETISPLTLDKGAGEVFVALAERGLPCTIIPMPLTGMSCPVTPTTNIVMANAEVLGTMTAIRSLKEDAPVSGAVISGIMDMATGCASFSAPEVILQDMGICQLYAQLYGLDFGMGTGYIDAKYPGVQSVIEKKLKIIAAYSQGHTNYPVGILDGGKTFCAEEALIELEIAESIHRFFDGIVVDDETLVIDLIQKVGIGGNFIAEEHTLHNFRKSLWHPALFDRQVSQGLDKDKERDMLWSANKKCKKVMEEKEPYQLNKSQIEEIDAIVREAEEAILK